MDQTCWTVVPKARFMFGRQKGQHIYLRKAVSGINAPLRSRVVLLPVKDLPLRVPKFDVPLDVNILRAVHAQQTILTRMVLFNCNTCVERFPAFNPAFEPPASLGMALLRRAGNGVAACNIEVHMWDSIPPLDLPDVDVVVASEHTGLCRACHVDIEAQMRALGADADDMMVIPKRSFLNHMDPVFKFPREELQDLFDSCSLVESMLLAMDHMQVNFVTVARSRLHKFRRNVISFPQDVATFAKRVGLMQRYELGDHVNSVRGPGDQRDRPIKYAYAATAEDRASYAQDEAGCLVFPATVREILPDGLLVLDYRCGGDGAEEIVRVWPRIRMPCHPKFLKGQLTIMLRRNLGHGRALEGLEVRWGLVGNVLRALTCLGPWRLDGSVGPMHKCYDPRMFEFMSEDEIKAQCATHDGAGQAIDCQTGLVLADAAFDVRYIGSADED